MNDVGLRRFLDWRNGVRSVKGIVGMDIVIAKNGDVGVVAECQPDGCQFELFGVSQTEICGTAWRVSLPVGCQGSYR